MAAKTAEALVHGANSRATVLATWAEGLRLDARRPQQLRDLTVEFPCPTDRNHAVATLGRTVVSACVTVAMVEPPAYSPKSGFFDITVRGADAGAGTRTPALIELSALLEAMFKLSGAVDVEALCILPGRYAWSLCLTVTVLSDDGNAVDAAVVACTAALRHARRPELTIANDTVTQHTAREREPVALSLHHTPVAVSAAVLPGGFALDPSPGEAHAASCCVTVALTPSLQVCGVHKRDGLPCDYPTIQAVLAVAKGIVCAVDDVITAAMTADEAERKAAARAQFEWARTRTGVSKHQK